MEDKIIKKYIKQFVVIKIKEIKHLDRKIEFTFDEATGVCLGILIDEVPILLGTHTIIPHFTYSKDTELDTYYLYKIYDYGVNIPIEDGFIKLEEEPEILREQYEKIVEWYYSEIKDKEKQNIKSFEKERAKLLEK